MRPTFWEYTKASARDATRLFFEPLIPMTSKPSDHVGAYVPAEVHMGKSESNAEVNQEKTTIPPFDPKGDEFWRTLEGIQNSDLSEARAAAMQQEGEMQSRNWREKELWKDIRGLAKQGVNFVATVKAGHLSVAFNTGVEENPGVSIRREESPSTSEVNEVSGVRGPEQGW